MSKADDFDFERNVPIDAMTGHNLCVANIPAQPQPPSIAELMALTEKFKREAGPMPYSDGADMSPETWEKMKLFMSHAELSSGQRLMTDRLGTIEVHLVVDIPLGEVRECRCEKYVARLCKRGR